MTMGRILFANASVLDGENPAQPGSTVVVDGNTIVAVENGPLRADPGDRVVDCGGRTIMPGLVQGHWHPSFHRVTKEPLALIALDRPPAYFAYISAYNAQLALRAGVTSLVGAGAPWDIDPSLRDAINDGLLAGPRIVPGSRDMITTADSNDMTPWWWQSSALAFTRPCDGPDEFRGAVRDEIKRGAEMIKIFATGGHGVRLDENTSSLALDEMHMIVETAHALGVRVRAHVASKKAIMNCLGAGVDIIDHGDNVDEECIEAMAERGTILLPSVYSHFVALSGYGILDGPDPESSPYYKRLRQTCEMLPAVVEAGVTVCLGDDFGAVIMPHGEYGPEPGMYAEWTGLPALEILKWGTVNGGRLVGLDNLGKIAPGYLADLLVVDGDPSRDLGILADQDNVVTVVRDGAIVVDRLSGAPVPGSLTFAARAR